MTATRSASVQVRFHATLRDAVGGRAPELGLAPPFSARALLAHVVARWPRTAELMLDGEGALRTQVHVFVNGRDVRYQDGGLDGAIRAGDQVDVFPAVGGG